MEIEVDQISLEAFKAFASATLDIQSLPIGLHLVRGRNFRNSQLGSNGSGKTSLLSDAPTWCIYGRTTSGLRHTDVRQWSARTPTRVTMIVRAGNRQMAITRGPRATDLLIDDRQVGPDDVINAVGLDWESWCQAVVMGQGAPLFLDLPPAGKMELLADALGLERWERRAQDAALRARDAERKVAEAAGEAKGLRTALESALNALKTAQDALQRWGLEKAARLQKIAPAAITARKRADELEDQRDKAALDADAIGLALREQRRTLDEQRAAAHDAKRRRLDAVRRIDALAADLRRVRNHIQSLDRERRCPVCGQNLPRGEAEKHADKLRREETELDKQRRAAERELASAESKIARLAPLVQDSEQRLHELETKEHEAASKLLRLERETAAAKAQARAAMEEQQRLEEETNPYRDAVREAKRSVEATRAALEQKEAEARQLTIAAEQAQFWARGFREIRLGIISDVLEDLQATTAEILDQLGLGEWEINYSTERETKTGTTHRELAVSIRAPDAHAAVRWEVYSGGERQRLRLAAALALSEVLLAHANVRINFRVLDEPTRGLSREGVADLVSALAEYARRADLKIFYIDHMAEEGAAFASTITVSNGPDGAALEITS